MMEILNGKSMDLTEDNLNKLKELFPEVFEEGKIDFDKLRLILGDEVEDKEERYEFTWHGKNNAIRIAQTPSTGTLRPDKASSKNWDDTENLYIEGDNLEVLKLLQKSYFGKVKMIYIDPPYNTGKDFVYHDDFRDNIANYKEITNQSTRANPETNGRYHTDWLNMMYPRLKLARNLLRDDGVIFISIDDNEVNNLRKMCDEIFGEENFAAQIIWQKVYSPRMDAIGFSISHDYILCYVKENIESINREEFEQNDKQFNYFDSKKGLKYRRRSIRKEGSNSLRSDAPNSFFPLIAPDGQSVYPIKPDGTESCWRWSIDTYNENVKNDMVEWVKTSNGWQVYAKQYYNNDSKKPPETIWFNNEVNHNHGGAEELKKIMSGKIFDSPKPKELIMKAMKIGANNNDIILDLFSGSSTTAHAVIQSNVSEGFNNKFIMVQLPEKIDEKSEAYKAGYKNICEIGKERIRRSGELIKQEYQKSNPGKEFTTDIGFKVFKLDSTNIKPWENTNKLDIEQLSYLEEVFKKDRSKEDILYEILLKYGLFDMPVSEVDINGKTMYRVGRRYMLVCLEDNINASDIKEVIELSPKVVVFKETGFNNDNDKINAEYNLKKAGIEEIKCI